MSSISRGPVRMIEGWPEPRRVADTCVGIPVSRRSSVRPSRCPVSLRCRYGWGWQGSAATRVRARAGPKVWIARVPPMPKVGELANPSESAIPVSRAIDSSREMMSSFQYFPMNGRKNFRSRQIFPLTTKIVLDGRNELSSKNRSTLKKSFPQSIKNSSRNRF